VSNTWQEQALRIFACVQVGICHFSWGACTFSFNGIAEYFGNVVLYSWILGL